MGGDLMGIISPSEQFQGLPPQWPSGARQVALLRGTEHVGDHRCPIRETP